MNCGADGDDFVRVNTLVRGFIDQRMGSLDDFRHTGHAADEHQLVNFICRHVGIFQTILYRGDRPLKQIIAKLLHLRAGQFQADMFGPAGISRDERQINFIHLGAGESDFGFLGFFFDTLEGIRLLAQIHALILLELVEDPIHDPAIPIVTTQVGITVGGFDFKHSIADFQHRNIERAAAQVIHGDFLVLFLIQSVGQRCGSGLIDNAEHFQAGNAPGVLCRLALGIVEISRDGNDCLVDFFPEAHFGIALELPENHGGDFRRTVLLGLALDLDLDKGIIIGTRDDFVGDAFTLLL